MVSPQVVTEEPEEDPFDEPDNAPEPEPETAGETSEPEIEVDATDLEDTELEASAEPQKEELADPVFADAPGEDFFDGADDAPGIHTGPADDAGDGPDLGGLGPEGATAGGDDDDEEPDVSFEDTINSGFARLAVVGLDENEGKDDLREEFKEVMQEFKLGHYGDEVMKEYMLEEEDDIHPVWGFCGALVLCFGLVVYMRPDGDEIMSNVTDTLGSFGNLPDKLQRN